MANRRLILALAALVALLVLAGCSGGSDEAGGETSETSGGEAVATEPLEDDDTLTVGWIFAATDTTGSVGALEAAFPDQIQSVVEENVGDVEAAATSLASQGAELVLSEVPGACAAVPDVACVDPGFGDDPGANAVGLDEAFWNRAYLLGRAAGELTRSDNIGFVVGERSPQTTAAVNAFALGCQETNVDCLVRLAVTPENPRNALRRFSNQDVDVIATTLDGSALCESAGEQVVAIQPVVTPGDPCGRAMAVGTLAAVAQPLVEQLLEGEWQGGRAVALPLGQWAELVPADVRERVEEAAGELEGGRNPFVGPLFDNRGEERLAEGEELTPEELASGWDWFLGGVFEPGS